MSAARMKVPAHHLVGMDLGFTCTNCGGHTPTTPPCIPEQTVEWAPVAPEPADQTRADVVLRDVLRRYLSLDAVFEVEAALAAERAEHAAEVAGLRAQIEGSRLIAADERTHREAAEATAARVADLCARVIDVHSHVVMDTPKDRALHDRAIAVFCASLRAALDGEREGRDGSEIRNHYGESL